MREHWESEIIYMDGSNQQVSRTARVGKEYSYGNYQPTQVQWENETAKKQQQYYLDTTYRLQFKYSKARNAK